MASRRPLLFALAFASFMTLSVSVAREWGAYATALVCGLLGLLSAAALWSEIRRPMTEVLDFLSALRTDELASLAVPTGAEPLQLEMRKTVAALQARDAAAKAETVRQRAILEHTPDALIEIDGDRVEALNRAARRELGAVSSLAALDRSEPGLGTALATIRPGIPVLWRTGEGARRWHITAKWLRTATGRRTIVSIQDIDNALGRAEFDAWRDLIRVVNHEIINALTPISSLAETSRALAEQLPGDDPSAGPLKGVTASLVERAATLRSFIGSYRDLSRVPPPNIETVHLDALLGTLVNELNELSDVRIEFRSEVEPLVVALDASLVQQAVLNLIVNAQEAVRSQGATAPVSVLVRGRETSLGDREVIIEVADRGPGVAPQAADHLFVPFFTTKSEGTGVGLSLVRQICLAHRGYVRWENRPDGGARFGVHLPDHAEVEPGTGVNSSSGR